MIHYTIYPFHNYSPFHLQHLFVYIFFFTILEHVAVSFAGAIKLPFPLKPFPCEGYWKRWMTKALKIVLTWVIEHRDSSLRSIVKEKEVAIKVRPCLIACRTPNYLPVKSIWKADWTVLFEEFKFSISDWSHNNEKLLVDWYHQDHGTCHLTFVGRNHDTLPQSTIVDNEK